MQPLQLSRELNITAVEALSILKSLQVTPSADGTMDTTATTTSSSSSTFSAFQLSNLHTGERFIITFCRAIDIMLGGGVPIGQITELVGLPGIGKTQMCIQLALNVQLPQVSCSIFIFQPFNLYCWLMNVVSCVLIHEYRQSKE